MAAVVFRRPWAIDALRKLRTLGYIYIAVIVLAAVYRVWTGGWPG